MLIANFLIMLHAAYQENFKVGLYTWDSSGRNNQNFYTNLLDHIDQIESSPYASAAYRDGSGRLAVWVSDWSHFDTLAGLLSNMINLRRAFYIFAGNKTIGDPDTLRSGITNGSDVTRIAGYNYPTSTGCAFQSDVSTAVDNYQANGYVGISHPYPYFDERRYISSNPRYCASNDYALLSNYFSEVTAGAPEIVLLESWNDFNERTAIEPGFDINAWRNLGQEQIWKGDPFRTLKQIASYNGITWSRPRHPCAIVDSVLISAGKGYCGLRAAASSHTASSWRSAASSRVAASARDATW